MSISQSQSHSQNPNPIFWRISNECPLDVCWISAGCPPDIRSFRRDLDREWNWEYGTVIWDLGKQGIQADELDLPADETDEKTRTPRISTAKRGSDEMDERMS